MSVVRPLSWLYDQSDANGGGSVQAKIEGKARSNYKEYKAKNKKAAFLQLAMHFVVNSCCVDIFQ